jgi:hypothetical protein
MLKEINVAAEFFARLFRLQAGTPQYDKFMASLSAALRERCQNHWHPTLHSAHRAVTIFGGVPDQVLLDALRAASLDDQPEKIVECVPKELVVWIDPSEVAFRVGDRGQPATLYKEGADSDSDSSCSEGSDASLLRTPSPPVSRAVRITAPSNAPTLAAPVASPFKPTQPTVPSLSPLGQAVMNAAARTQHNASLYVSCTGPATPATVFASQTPSPPPHYLSQQKIRGTTYYAQSPQPSHHRRPSQTHSNGKSRANSPTKSMVRYVEAR